MATNSSSSSQDRQSKSENENTARLKKLFPNSGQNPDKELSNLARVGARRDEHKSVKVCIFSGIALIAFGIVLAVVGSNLGDNDIIAGLSEVFEVLAVGIGIMLLFLGLGQMWLNKKKISR
jgi:hypothetical protein